MVSTYNSFADFAARIEEIERTKEDYVVSTESVRMTEPEAIDVTGLGSFKLTPHATGQLADRLQIPRKFWDRTTEYTGLREEIVNTMFQQKPERRMVRTLDGDARAWLSDRYKPRDNWFVLNAISPTLAEHKDLEVNARSLSETRMYLQITFPRIEFEVTEGDVVRAGLTISNSEVGAGAVNVETLIWRLVCKNGMIGQSLLRSTHVGSRIDFDDARSYDVFKDDTMEAELHSLRLRLRDVVAAAISESAFEQEVAKLRTAAGDMIKEPEPTIENVTQRYGLPDSARTPLLVNMAEERNMNRYGLANAITNWAQTLDSRDAQYEAERISSKLIAVTPREWAELVA